MKTILIIDDDAVFQKTIKTKLEGLSYKVTLASDGEDGLSMVETDRPDLILLDIMMPKMNGIDFLKQLKLKKEFANIPIIITSNIETPEKIGEGTSLGIRAYIIKSNETLETIVGEIQGLLKE